MKIFDKLIQVNETKRKWVFSNNYSLPCWVLSLEFMGLEDLHFYANSVLIGLCSTFLYGYKNRITKSEAIWIGLQLLQFALWRKLIVLQSRLDLYRNGSTNRNFLFT
jgi:hypothetical protein